MKKVAAEKTELFFYDLARHTIEILEVKTGTDHVRDLVFVEDEPMGFVDQDVEVGTSFGPVAWEFDGRLPSIPLGVAVGAVAGLALLSIPAIRRRPKSAVAVITLAAVAGGVSVARSQGGGATFHWIHTDHLGTPLAATNTPVTASQATTIWRATYSPFGEATLDEDPDGNMSLVALSLRLPGQLADAETGLEYNYFRNYDGDVGRYVEPDPVGLAAGVNLYAYAENKTLQLHDRFGLDTTVLTIRDYGIGTHSAVHIGDTGTGQPGLYDPAGSFMPTTGEPRGSGDFLEGSSASVDDFIRFHEQAGSTVEVTVLPTTPDHEARIAQRAMELGGAQPFLCTVQVSQALEGVCGTRRFFLPGRLADEARRVTCP